CPCRSGRAKVSYTTVSREAQYVSRHVSLMLNGVRLLSEGSLSGDTWEARLPVELRSLRQLRRRKVRIREQSDRRALPSRQSIVPRSATPFPGTRARITTGSGSSVEQRDAVLYASFQILSAM